MTNNQLPIDVEQERLRIAAARSKLTEQYKTGRISEAEYRRALLDACDPVERAAREDREWERQAAADARRRAVKKAR